MKKHIPNTITCCNLMSGCVATYCAFNANYTMALSFIIIGAVFDFFDGFSARLLKVSSPVGKELDSLADDITFGFAPSALAFSMMSESLQGYTATWVFYIPFVAFIMAAFSGLRLAKFNLDERQTMGFIGLPTPANALFWASLSILPAWKEMPAEVLTPLLLLGILICSYLLISEIPMFALKFKTFGWSGNELRYSFIALSLLMIVLLQIYAFIVIIPLYIVISCVNVWMSHRKM